MAKQNSSIFNFSFYILKLFTVIFICGFLLSYLFEKNIVFKSAIGGAYKVNRILKETYVNEIPIFGSSRAQGNFVPSLIDSRCYNYGINGTQANIWLFFLEQELKKEKSTPIIINYDLGGLAYRDGDIGSYIPNWKATKSILKTSGEFYYYIPFVKYFGEYANNLKFYLNSKIGLTKIIDQGGSFEKNTLKPQKFQELVEKRLKTESEFDLDSTLLSKFNTLIESTDRKIILVVSPYHMSYFNKFYNVDIANLYLDELNKKNNIFVFDFRDYVKNDTMYLNTTHLNYEGAKEFSIELKTTLQNILK